MIILESNFTEIIFIDVIELHNICFSLYFISYSFQKFFKTFGCSKFILNLESVITLKSDPKSLFVNMLTF